MKIVAAVLVIVCAYLHAADNLKLKPIDILKDAVSGIKNVASNVTYTVIPECVFGVESVSMVLYNRDNPYGKKIGVDDDDVCDGLNLSMPIAFLVHGFISNPNYTNSYKLSEALVEKGFTVFSLDWTDAACTTGLPLVKFLAYPAAVINTRKIGELMASYVISLNQKCSVPMNNIRFFGHSLGAHVCGFASKHIQQSGYEKISLLIGFDPAQPLFILNKCENRFCKQDADLVIALHTSVLGITRPIGHADFYCNGGSMQPKCNIDIACSHSSAVLYMAKIIKDSTCKFPSVPMSYPDVTLLWKKPDYPQSNTTKCTVLNNIWSWIDGKNETFDKDKEQVYYTFVNSDTFCANDNFSCQD